MAVRKLIVASSKGGVGKSTVALGVANALCDLGKKILLCDLDFENSCLDLFMGIENTALFNAGDVARGIAPVSKAILSNSRGLSFLSAPDASSTENGIDDDYFESIVTALNGAIEFVKPDFVIFDTGTARRVPARLSESFPGSEALIVASHQSTSGRGAERTAATLEEHGIKSCSLVICGYEFYEASSGERNGLLAIIDTSKVPLLGVVPYDRELMLCSERGVKTPKGTPAGVAFGNIAKRICGKRVRIFNGIGVSRKKII
ncbi:MAG: P-loop NTPase [Clostridia bacterium]|nr:P-loop NTPase [Clostridia bacterium]